MQLIITTASETSAAEAPAAEAAAAAPDAQGVARAEVCRRTGAAGAVEREKQDRRRPVSCWCGLKKSDDGPRRLDRRGPRRRA